MWIQRFLVLILMLALQTAVAADCPQTTPTSTPERRALSLQIADPNATPEAVVRARIRRAALDRAAGRFGDARADLTSARQVAQQGGWTRLEILATQGLGQVLAHEGRTAEALPQLREAFTAAERTNQPTLIALTADSLGTLLVQQGDSAAARRVLERGLAAAQQTNDAALEASLRLALAGAGVRDPAAQLRQAATAAQRCDTAAEQTQLQLKIATQARTLGQTALAQQSAQTALTLAQTHQLNREHAQALALLSEQAASQGRRAEAIERLTQALHTAPFDAYDLRYRWEWELGQLLRRQGDPPRAIAAYRRAVDHLERIRYDIPIEYAEGRSSFRETLEPLYLGLADLLLQTATQTANPISKQTLLREARSTVEQIKLDELRDYFRDACILPLREDIDRIAARTAVLYPVILPERLELLLSVGREIYQATVPVTAGEVEQVAAIMALKLRYERPTDDEARQLYGWLLRPFERTLREQRVETLVFVPDSGLRAVPLAALRDEQGYLIERYAIATTPGLKLLQPEALQHGQLNLLLAGLSEPGPVVDELPSWWLEAMVSQYRQMRGEERGARRGTSVSAESAGQARLRGVSREEKVAALALPGVVREVDQLAERLPGEVLRDQEFLLERFLHHLDDAPFRVVHIASHGLFLGSPEDNFILTYDRRLDMNQLAEALKPKELAEQPVEILVLSACQTAEGDDRTPLGLSGVALQSGARSALGSLWPVSDAAAQLLMTEFYAALQQPNITKGQALQQAQRALIEHPRHHHPSDWAAFILVGNWL